MKNNKITLMFFAILLIGFLFLIVMKNSSNKIVNDNHKNSVEKYEDDDEFVQIEKMEEDLKNFDENIKNIDEKIKLDEQNLDFEKKYIPKVFNNIFNQLDINSVKTLKKKLDVKPVEAISVDENSIVKINKGDIFELPLLGNSVYNVKVDQKIKNKHGSVTITGNLVENSNYSVIMTKGKERTFMTVSTPDGSYEVEIKNGEGYVYSVKDIDKQRIDYTKSDTLIPPTHGK